MCPETYQPPTMTRPITMPPTIISRFARNWASLNTNAANAAASTKGMASFAAARRTERRRKRGQVRRRCPQAGDVEAPRVEGVDPPHREEPFQRHVGRDTQHHHHDHGLQIAGACPDQRLAAAAGGQRHPEAEQEPAGKAGHPPHLRRRVDGLGRVDDSSRNKYTSASHGHSDSKYPHTHAPPVPEIGDIGDRAHGAKVDPVGNGAEHESQREGQARDQK